MAHSVDPDQAQQNVLMVQNACLLKIELYICVMKKPTKTGHETRFSEFYMSF